MRYTPDTETPPAQPSAGVSGQKGTWESGVGCRGLTATLGPCGQGSSGEGPTDQTLETVDRPCFQKSLSSRNFSLQPSGPLLCLVHSAVSHGLRRDNVPARDHFLVSHLQGTHSADKGLLQKLAPLSALLP